LSLPKFDRPKKTTAWAREAINELDANLREFFSPKPRGPILHGSMVHGQVMEIDSETGHEIHKFKLLKTLPSSLDRRATEALNNLRNAFDQAVYAACASIGEPPKKGNRHFPWRQDPTDLGRTLEKGSIPTKLWDVIKREEPYPTGNGYAGGDDIIRKIATLANKKHTVGLTITPRITSYTHPSIAGSGNHVMIPMPQWDKVKNEMIMAIVSPGMDVKHDYKVEFQVALDVPAPLGDIPAISLLNAFANRAARFTEKIEAECKIIMQ